MTITIEKTWDENERIREASNGRIYVSTAGRWLWLVCVDGVPYNDYDTRREAKEAVASLAQGGK